MPSIVAEKNATTNILGRTEGQTDGSTNRSKTIYPPQSTFNDLQNTIQKQEIDKYEPHQEPGCELSCYRICVIKSILYRQV